jgi:phosphoenolpyruvate carboxylase
LSLQLGELTECWGYKSGFSKNKNELSLDEQNVMGQLASLGYKKYLSFKNHPKFIPYLEQMSTLKYYAKTNIGSRPSKKGSQNS